MDYEQYQILGGCMTEREYNDVLVLVWSNQIPQLNPITQTIKDQVYSIMRSSDLHLGGEFMNRVIHLYTILSNKRISVNNHTYSMLCDEVLVAETLLILEEEFMRLQIMDNYSIFLLNNRLLH